MSYDCKCQEGLIDPEDELGFAPLVAALAPMAAQVGGQLLSGGGGGGGDLGNILGSVLGGIGDKGASGGGGLDLASILGGGVGPAVQAAARGADVDEIRAVVREIVSTVPSPVVDQVRLALEQNKTEKAAQAQIAESVNAEMLPKILTALEALKLAQSQRVATSEHNSIVQNSTRWDANEQSQARIIELLGKLERVQQSIEARLSKAGIVAPRAIGIVGPGLVG